MSVEPLGRSTIDAGYEALLKRFPGAVVAAIGPDGFRVPVPPGRLDAFASFPVPPDRATMLDLVVPEDVMTVITAWERVLRSGMARESVRMRSEPDRYVGLTFLDMRHREGALVAVVTEDDAPRPPVAEGARDAAAIAPLRPRTATVTKSMYAVITDIDDRGVRMLGFDREEIVGQRSSEFVHPEDQERAIANWMEMLSQKTAQRVRLRHRRQDGSWIWVEIENLYEDAETPDDVVIRAQMSDISDEMAAYEVVRQREELFRRLAETLPIGILQVDVGRRVVYENDRLRAIMGVAGAEVLEERLSTVTGDSRDALDAALDQVLTHGLDQVIEVALRLPENGERRRCAVTMTALTSREGSPGALVTVDDITESSRLREELRFKATYDTLTGCHNRESVMALLEAEVGRGPADSATAVVFIDLDDFKPVNDRLGHAAGDELLVVAADRLREVLREGDTVGRIGGDEFLLLCHGAGGEEQVRKLAGRVHQALHQDVDLQAGTVRLAGSIGIAVTAAGLTADQVVAHADAAMYESKRLGDGTPVLFDGERSTVLR